LIESEYVIKCLDYFKQDSEFGDIFIFIVENPNSCLKDVIKQDGGKSERLNNFLLLWSQILTGCNQI
jgi:hypothetical protein